MLMIHDIGQLARETDLQPGPSPLACPLSLAPRAIRPPDIALLGISWVSHVPWVQGQSWGGKRIGTMMAVGTAAGPPSVQDRRVAWNGWPRALP